MMADSIQIVIIIRANSCFGKIPEGRCMSTHLISEAEKNLRQLINEVIESHKPVIITNEGNNAVLLSEEDWSSIQEALYLLAVPGMRESIKEGLVTPTEECAEKLDW